MRFAIAAIAALVPFTGVSQTIAPDTEFRVKLLSPLAADTNKKGDKITAQVVAPQEFAGDAIDGEVREAKAGGKMKAKSVLNFTFQTLHHQGQEIPISSQVKSFTNSQGKANVDEEGRVIQKKNNLGKAAVATGIGALIGGIAGGAKGAAIGAGVGAAASIVLIQVAVEGANVRFAPGSEVILSVKEGRK